MGDSRSRVEERRRKAGREGTQDKRRVSGELIVAQKDLSPSHRKKERNQPKHNAEKKNKTKRARIPNGNIIWKFSAKKTMGTCVTRPRNFYFSPLFVRALCDSVMLYTPPTWRSQSSFTHSHHLQNRRFVYTCHSCVTDRSTRPSPIADDTVFDYKRRLSFFFLSSFVFYFFLFFKLKIQKEKKKKKSLFFSLRNERTNVLCQRWIAHVSQEQPSKFCFFFFFRCLFQLLNRAHLSLHSYSLLVDINNRPTLYFLAFYFRLVRLHVSLPCSAPKALTTMNRYIFLSAFIYTYI